MKTALSKTELQAQIEHKERQILAEVEALGSKVREQATTRFHEARDNAKSKLDRFTAVAKQQAPNVGGAIVAWSIGRGLLRMASQSQRSNGAQRSLSPARDPEGAMSLVIPLRRGLATPKRRPWVPALLGVVGMAAAAVLAYRTYRDLTRDD